jgi:hypothetical protein
VQVQKQARHRGEFYLEDEPRLKFDGSAVSADGLETVFNLCAAQNLIAKSKPGTLLVERQVSAPTVFHGPGYAYASGSRLVLKPSFSDVTKAVLDASNRDGIEVKDLFIGNPSAATADDRIAAIGLRLGRPGQTPQENYKCGRVSVERVRCFGLETGGSFQGWSGDIKQFRGDYCATGFIGDFLNACTVDIKVTENIRDFTLTNSDSVTLTVLAEGSRSDGLSSTIDNCRDVDGNIYLEQSYLVPRSTPYLIIGGTKECKAIKLTIHVGQKQVLTSGYRAVRLDRLDQTSVITVVGDAGDMHSLMDITENCKALVLYQEGRGQWPLDNGQVHGPAYNYFPNPQFDCWLRGWNRIVPTNTTITKISAATRWTVTGAANNGSGAIRLTVASHGLLTAMRMEVRGVGGVTNANGHWTITVIDANNFDLQGSTFAGTYTSGGSVKYGPAMIGRGQNAILLKSATAQTNNNVEFRLTETYDTVASPSVLALRGKRIRVGMWAFIPKLADFAESTLGAQPAQTAMYAYSGNSGGATYSNSDTVSPDGRYPAGSYGHHTVTDSREFLWCETEVLPDATVIFVTPYMNQGGTMTNTLGQNFIVIQSIHITVASVPLRQMMEGALVDSPAIDAKTEGGLVTITTDRTTLADPNQIYVVGDRLKPLTPTFVVGDANMRTVSTAGAGGGTAALTITAKVPA